MVNVLLALRLFGPRWKDTKILVKCDKNAVVQVLTNGRTLDAFLAACGQNVLLGAAECNIDILYVHVLGRKIQVADLLSSWHDSYKYWQTLLAYIPNPICQPVVEGMIESDNGI